jgi:hypothetical protein
MENQMTEQQARENMIEIKVEKWTDRVDARFMAGKLTQSEYDTEIKAISDWADQAYRFDI